MADYTVKRIEEMEGAFGGGLKKVRAELGVSSFGVQVIELPPNFSDYPEHDHAEEGQEEVYAPVKGSGEIEVDGERIAISPEVIIRVGPASRRKLFSGPEGLRVLAMGAVPGKAYTISPMTELGSA
jgi:mannose-6-phosphate isomerase-like protein (cupin superfamily)